MNNLSTQAQIVFDRAQRFFTALYYAIKDNRRAKIALGIALVFVLILFFRTSRESQTVLQPVPTPIPAQTYFEEFEGDTSDWSSLGKKNYSFDFKYPKLQTTILKDEEGFVSLLIPRKLELNTEITDGIVLAFSEGNLEGKTLREVVNENLEQTRKTGAKILKEPEPITIGEFSGYSFKYLSVGENTDIFVVLDNSRYLRIIDGTRDPSSVGYEKVLEAILESISKR